MANFDVETPTVENPILDSVVDYKGQKALRRGSGQWRSAGYILGQYITCLTSSMTLHIGILFSRYMVICECWQGAGIAERFAFYGVAANLIMYLTGMLGQPMADAAVNVNAWIGAATMLPLLGGFVADSFLGYYRTIVASSVLYILGLGLLTLSVSMPYLSGSDCQRNHTTSCSPSLFQLSLLFFSLYLVAVAQSGHRPCVTAFGADQFDDDDPEEAKSKSSFFNWTYFGMSASILMAYLAVSYIQENISWGLGFGVLCFTMILGFFVFLLGTKTYRFSVTRNEKSPLTRISRVFVAAFKNRRVKSSSLVADTESHKVLLHQCSNQFEFLNKALKAPKEADERGWFCSVTEVEEAKAVLRLLPIWGSCLVFGIYFAQPTTFFTKQSATLDRTIFSWFKIPAASFYSVASATVLVSLPIYDRVLVPTARYFTGKPSGITMLQRIGTGLFLSMITLATAALVEIKRIRIAKEHGLVNKPDATLPMSIWWMAPQMILFGVANAFTIVGVQEFFYDQVPKELKSIGIALFLSVLGVGSFLSSFLVLIIKQMTGGDGRDNWFSSNLNKARLDNFYWVLAGMSALAFVTFLHITRAYVYNNRT